MSHAQEQDEPTRSRPRHTVGTMMLHMRQRLRLSQNDVLQHLQEVWVRKFRASVTEAGGPPWGSGTPWLSRLETGANLPPPPAGEEVYWVFAEAYPDLADAYKAAVVEHAISAVDTARTVNVRGLLAGAIIDRAEAEMDASAPRIGEIMMDQLSTEGWQGNLRTWAVEALAQTLRVCGVADDEALQHLAPEAAQRATRRGAASGRLESGYVAGRGVRQRHTHIDAEWVTRATETLPLTRWIELISQACLCETALMLGADLIVSAEGTRIKMHPE